MREDQRINKNMSPGKADTSIAKSAFHDNPIDFIFVKVDVDHESGNGPVYMHMQEQKKVRFVEGENETKFVDECDVNYRFYIDPSL